MTAQVTIITPTYNKPSYFAQCAESVLAQTYQDWVWWVVFNFEYEDASGAASYDYKPFRDPRILPFWYPVGPRMRSVMHVTAHIVNWLYPKVQTPYIYFLADDDLIDEHGLEKLVNAIAPIDGPPEHVDYFEWSKMRYPCPACCGSGLTKTGYSCSACTGSGVDNQFSMRYLGNERPVARVGLDAVYGRVECQNEQPDGSFITSGWIFEGKDVGLGTDVPRLDCILDSSSILHTKALWDKMTADGWQLTDRIESAPHADGILLDRVAQFATVHYVPQRISTHRRTRLSEWHKPQI